MNPTDQQSAERIDTHINQILHVLATAPAPAGLEQRLSARLAQHTAEVYSSAAAPAPFRAFANRFSNPTSFALGAAALAALTLGVFTLVTHHSEDTIAKQVLRPMVAPQAITAPQTIQGPTARSIAAWGTAPVIRPASDHRAESPTYTTVAASSDPDAIALAETFAPSHPAPPLPLSMQEALLLRSTRHGQPIELAELGTRRQTALMTLASAREQSSLRAYIHGLLGPLATAQALTPSPFSQPPPPDDTQPVAEPQPPSSK